MADDKVRELLCSDSKFINFTCLVRRQKLLQDEEKVALLSSGWL